MPARKTNAKAILSVVDWRLYETMQAFEVLRLLNDRMGPGALHDSVNASLGFWHPVTIGLQATFILGVFALLDEGSAKDATLYAVREQLRAAGDPDPSIDFWDELGVIRKRYERARHKLFGHNDTGRDDEVLTFASLGLTWRMVEADITTLRRAVKALYAVAAGRAVPTKEDLDASLHEHDLAVIRTRRDTTTVLNILSSTAASEA